VNYETCELNSIHYISYISSIEILMSGSFWYLIGLGKPASDRPRVWCHIFRFHLM